MHTYDTFMGIVIRWSKFKLRQAFKTIMWTPPFFPPKHVVQLNDPPNWIKQSVMCIKMWYISDALELMTTISWGKGVVSSREAGEYDQHVVGPRTLSGLSCSSYRMQGVVWGSAEDLKQGSKTLVYSLFVASLLTY